MEVDINILRNLRNFQSSSFRYIYIISTLNCRNENTQNSSSSMENTRYDDTMIILL